MSFSVDLPIERAPDLGDPASPEAIAIRAAYWALDGRGAIATLCSALPRLSVQLAHRTMRRRVEQPVVRGRVDWPATIRARAATANDSATVTRVVERSYDVLENQLLRSVVARAVAALDTLPPAIRAGAIVEASGTTVAIGSVAGRVALLRAALSDRGLGRRLATVTLPGSLDRRWLDAARAAGIREYELVATAHDAWTRDVAAATWERTIRGTTVLLPASPEPRWLAVAAHRSRRPH